MLKDPSKRRRAIAGGAWIALYLVLCVAPLFFVFVGSTRPSRDFLTELAVGFGFVGLAMLGDRLRGAGSFRGLGG